jgi:hypothetical protein
MLTNSNGPTVAVRLQGGLGDHILGMRVLKFVRQRYPEHAIVIYSDSMGHDVQAAVAAMSPYVARVVKVYHVDPKAAEKSGYRIETIRAMDLIPMVTSDLYIDACVWNFMVRAAIALKVPLFEIHNHRTELVVPPHAQDRAREILCDWDAYDLVAVNFANGVARQHKPIVERIVQALMQHPRVCVLNLFTSTYPFPHSPGDRDKREDVPVKDFVALSDLCTRHERMVACVDLSLELVAALLAKCRYFVGVDNGIKHLAWALGTPLTYFYPSTPRAYQALRVMPDVHRCLGLNCSWAELDAHLAEIPQYFCA